MESDKQKSNSIPKPRSGWSLVDISILIVSTMGVGIVLFLIIDNMIKTKKVTTPKDYHSQSVAICSAKYQPNTNEFATCVFETDNAFNSDDN